MIEFSELLNNQVLFWGVFSCLFAQFLKIFFNIFIENKFRFGVIFETGGMPSSHSSLISALAAGVGLELGFDTPLFALAVGISLIVMYDASGIRRSSGLQAIEINKISKALNSNLEEVLKEKLGHTKIEVFVGSLIGPLVTLLGITYLGSPSNMVSLLNKTLN